MSNKVVVANTLYEHFVPVKCPVCDRRLLDRNNCTYIEAKVITNTDSANAALVIKCIKCGNLIGLNN